MTMFFIFVCQRVQIKLYYGISPNGMEKFPMRQPSAVLVSTGVCIPPYAVSNDELVESFNQ